MDSDYNKLALFIEMKLQKPITKTKILLLLSEGLKFANNLQHLSHDEIKVLVIKAIKDAITRTDKIDFGDKQEILDMIDLIGNDVLEKLIVFAKDTVTFVRKKCSGVFKCCCKTGTERATSYQRAMSGELGQTGEQYDKLKNYLTQHLQKPFDASKIVGLTAAGVKFIENFTELSGVEKKNIVIHALREVINDSTRLSDAEKTAILDLIDVFVSDFIDLLVVFGRDSIKMVKNQSCWRRCR